jgi:hypothetical protein
MRLRAALASAAIAALAIAAPAEGKFVTGIDGAGRFFSSDEALATHWLDTAAGLGAGMVRLDIRWRSVAPTRPGNPSDPADPAYRFGALDRAVTLATARNMTVLFTFFDAPDWAQEAIPSAAYQGAWKPRPRALGEFAKAVARRYSGSFGGLPRVRFYEPWNEANIDNFLAPQYRRDKLASVVRYRKMVNAVAKGVDTVHRNNKVVVGSLAPYGDDPGGNRTRPLAFLRDLFCLNRKLKPTGCRKRIELDVLSHHPINLSGPPRQSAYHRDDSSSADLRGVRKILRAAEKAGTISGRGRHPLWVTEYWWESHPDGPSAAIPDLAQHGRWIEEALYLFWKAGAQVAIYYTLVDTPFDENRPNASLQAGLYLEDGSPKPAATAFRFPFVTERKTGKKVFAWGRAPVGGDLAIERQTQGGWQRIHGERVSPRQVFTANLKLRGDATLRATVGGDVSLPWPQGG